HAHGALGGFHPGFTAPSRARDLLRAFLMRSVILTATCLLILAALAFHPTEGPSGAREPLDGAEEVRFGDFFKRPIWPRGLEYTDAIQALDSKRVRIVGHMVQQSEPSPGLFLLAPFPMKLHEHEDGLWHH